MKDEFIIKNIKEFKKDIITKLTSRNSSHIERYLFIKREFSRRNIDDKFFKKFCYFYKLNGAGGLNKDQKTIFFDMLLKGERDLEKILVTLYNVYGYKNSRKLYLSFASKLIHTIDNELPIYDRNIASILNLPKQLRQVSLEEKIKNREDIYNELKERFSSLLLNKQIKDILKEFREHPALCRSLVQQDNLISDTKLLDSILWALYPFMNKNK